MVDVVAVIVEQEKNIYYVSPNGINVKLGDFVVFENNNCELYGRVSKETYSEKKDNLVLPLANVLRVATDSDNMKYEKNKKIADKALNDAKKLSVELNLPMNFVDAYFCFDNTQLILYFLADDRIDFRELVKKLAQRYKTRIELRQIGVRDKAKKIGGLGPCGLFLCCNSFLTDFNSVSINMAKNQMLALSPSKINGICGRLLCCLGYENDVYSELKRGLPKVGLVTDTPYGMGKVVSVDIFKRKYSVDLGEQGIMEFDAGDSDGKA